MRDLFQSRNKSRSHCLIYQRVGLIISNQEVKELKQLERTNVKKPSFLKNYKDKNLLEYKMSKM
jgi:hypothetical protein